MYHFIHTIFQLPLDKLKLNAKHPAFKNGLY